MDTTRWRKNSLINKLLINPQQFNFFQAVRLLEKVFGEQFLLGHDHAPNQEAIRFRVPSSLGFPASEINTIDALFSPIETPYRASVRETVQIKLFVNFIGLIGASGILPNHYTELLMQRLHAKDKALLDFLDIFHHRTISLFYRAWKKYRFYIPHLHIKNQQKVDTFSYVLMCLLGNGSTKARHRLLVSDKTLIFYSGLMQQPRSAINLECMLSDYFSVPVKIESFQGEWSQLQLTDRSRITARKTNHHNYNLLGKNVVLGSKIWEITNKFCIKIGELSYPEFKRLLPIGDKLKPLKELTRYYIGINLNFEIKLLLKKNEIPPLQLLRNTTYYLGWNAWLKIKTIPIQNEAAP